MKANERFKIVLAHLKSKGLGHSNKELMPLLGYKNPSAFSQVVNGKSVLTEPMIDKIKIIAPEVNINWLRKGEGEMILNAGLTSLPEDAYQWVEVVDLSTVVGNIGVDDIAALPDNKRMLVPKEYEEGKYLVTRVDGRSMENGIYSIHEGSHILIREIEGMNLATEPLNLQNNLYVIVSRNGTVLKQVVEHNMEHGYLKCHSYNPDFTDYKILFEDVLQLFIYRKIVSGKPPIPQIINYSCDENNFRSKT